MAKAGAEEAREAARRPFVPVMRELVRAYQAFERYDETLHRHRGLTRAQADVLFTLGNTEGMTMGEIGQRTLITKGTLTGVVDRLVAKGLVERCEHPQDGRCTLVCLTAAGVQLFESVFPEHIDQLGARFDALRPAELEEARRLLRRLRELFPAP
jgi:MarR family transcriptional regulator, 2-MHQ and catechol-resistance regulon repressor